MKRMKTSIDNSPFPRRSRASIADAIRASAALEALGLSLVNRQPEVIQRHIQIMFDRGSERPEFIKKVREFMWSWNADAPLVMDDVQWLSRDQELRLDRWIRQA
jgi:hypothetical protein